MKLPFLVPQDQLRRPDIQIGKIAHDLNAAGDGYRVPIWDVTKGMIKKIEKELDEFICKNLEDHEHFYVVIRLHKPPDAPNAIRALFFARRTACTPEPGLSLVEVNGCSGDLKWHWTLPDRDTMEVLLLNRHLVPKEEQDLLKNVIDYVEGRLGVDELHGSDRREGDAS